MKKQIEPKMKQVVGRVGWSFRGWLLAAGFGLMLVGLAIFGGSKSFAKTGPALVSAPMQPVGARNLTGRAASSSVIERALSVAPVPTLTAIEKRLLLGLPAYATSAMALTPFTPYTITKSATPPSGSTVGQGQIITYTITITNGGVADSTAGNGFIRSFDTSTTETVFQFNPAFPTGVMTQPGAGSAWGPCTITPNGNGTNQFTCYAGDGIGGGSDTFAANQAVVLKVDALVSNAATPGSTKNNTSFFETDLDGNGVDEVFIGSNTVSHIIAPSVDLGITKIAQTSQPALPDPQNSVVAGGNSVGMANLASIGNEGRGNISYVLTVSNLGPANATNVIIEDSIPGGPVQLSGVNAPPQDYPVAGPVQGQPIIPAALGVTAVSIANDTGGPPVGTATTFAIGCHDFSAGALLTCRPGNNIAINPAYTPGVLPAGFQARIAYRLRVLASASLNSIISDSARISSNGSADINAGNNTSLPTENVVITKADLGITKVTSNPTPTAGGAAFSYTLTVTNNGPSDAKNIIVNDPMPPGVIFQNVAVVNNPAIAGYGLICSGPPVATNGLVTCTGNLPGPDPNTAATSTSTITIVGQIIANVASGVRTNTATVISSTQETTPNVAPNTASVQQNIQVNAPLSITKAGPATLAPGATFTYHITVNNGGSSTALNATISDPLPANTTFLNMSATGGFVSGCSHNGGTPGTVTCAAVDIPTGQSTLDITVKLASNAPTGNLANTATITNAGTGTIAVGTSTSTATVNGLAVSPTTINATEGVPFSNLVAAKFIAAAIPTSNFTATINWGDGTASSAGVITSTGVGAFNVLGSHSYLEEGSYDVRVNVTDSTTSNTQSATSKAIVADAPLSIVPLPLSAGSSTTFTGVGGTANTALNAFKAAVGGADNGATPAPQANGFRSINWDAVALDGTDFGGNTTVIVPNQTVGIPVNRFQARGVSFDKVNAVSGDGFVSANAGVAGQFPAFSPTRTFAAFNDNTIDFKFVLPSATNTPPIQAVSRGFGAIFVDVETPNTTSVEYFSGTTSLGKFFVPVGATGQAEFFGVLFQNAAITNVRIVLGNATLFSFDGINLTAGLADNPGGGTDQAVADDFAYAEPTAVSTGISISATAGAPFTAKVASFTDADPNGQVSDYSVVIEWGDGTTSAGGVTPNLAQGDGSQPDSMPVSITPSINGGFDVTGTHTYAAAGAYTITTSIRDAGGASISGTASATVGGTPSLSINNVTLAEGNSGAVPATFTVTLSAATTVPVTVGYFTSDGTANAPTDYQSVSGTLTFSPGETTKTITVAVVGDTVFEPTENFFVNLANSTNATIATPQGTGTILDNDGFPTLAISNATAAEGDVGSLPETFTVTLSSALTQPVTVDYFTSDGTAKAPGDYQSISGTLTFSPGQTTKTIIVQVVGDTVPEPAENFFVNLNNATNATIVIPQGTGLIIDNDSVFPALSINNVTVTEPSSGSVPATFTVTLSMASSAPVTVDYFTSDNTATASEDYQFVSGTLTFSPGQTTRTISVPVAADTTPGPNETFFVNLQNPAGATIATAQGVGTIIENDSGGVLQFSATNYSVDENNPRVDITVTRTGNSGGSASVGFTTSDTAGLQNCNVFSGVASSRCDYETTIGTLQFDPGQTSRSFSVAIVNDSYAEGNESFTVSLNNPQGAALASPTTATVTIVDNDVVTGPNPIDAADFFVRQQYLDFLGREPDAPGLTGWVNTILNCAPGDTSCDRVHVSQAFFESEEFQQRGYFAYRFYSVSFGRKPTYAEFTPDLSRVSGFLDVNQLEAAKVAFIADFMARPAFVTTYNSLTNTQYVDTLLSTAGVTLPASARQALIDGLNGGTLTRAQVLRQIVERVEVAQKYFTQAFAVMEYFGYLRRDPDALFLNWVAALNSGTSARTMVGGFINSQEYRGRFGP